ncbi:MAG TPA: VOC family protein [Candidatus Limnocylindrales bacterium]
MAETIPPVAKPVWIDLSSSDPAASRDFYAKLFGWQIEVDPNPLYGGYAIAKVGGKEVAGIGPKMMAEAPTAWSVYIGTGDVAALAVKVQAAGGNVIAPPMQVGDQGTMAVFQDPSGAYFGAWQPDQMRGFATDVPGTFGWAELNSRGFDKAASFYAGLFGWSSKTSPMGEGQPPYTEFLLGDTSIAGGMEMNPMMPAEVPSYWMAYFEVGDVDGAFTKALATGAKEMLAAQDFPGGRFAIVQDPQGAVFGLLKTAAR